MNERYATDAFIPMNCEGRMSQAAALSMRLRVSEKSKLIECSWLNENAA